MQQFKVSLHVDSYIAHPYWPEMEKVINIKKESGMARARSSANARKALQEYLEAHKLTLNDYDRLVELANRHFYTKNGAGSEIIIPELHMISMIVDVCHNIRAAGRPVPEDQVRAVIKTSAFGTGKSAADGTWERFAVVSSGTGAKLSNQRGYRSNEYLKDFIAQGTIDLEISLVRPQVFQAALEWGGQHVGFGASRKMGWGRFQVTHFEEVKS